MLTLGTFHGFTLGATDYANPINVPVNLTLNDNSIKYCVPADILIQNGVIILRLPRYDGASPKLLYDISFAQWGFEYKIDDSM